MSPPTGANARLLGLLIVAMVVVATAFAFTQSGTMGIEPFEVVVLNDSDAPVNLSMCEFGDCGDERDTLRVEAGAELIVSAITDSNMRPQRIADGDGEALGCLPFLFRTNPPVEDLVVPVSDAVPCDDDFGASEVTEQDWPSATSG